MFAHIKHCEDDYLSKLINGIGKSSEALSRDGKIAVASSVTVFTMASILFFIVDFLCGHFCLKKRKQSSAASKSVRHRFPIMMMWCSNRK